MPEYKAPLREYKFLLDEVLDMPGHYASLPAYADLATPEMVDAIINEGAKFCENVISPLNGPGDAEGCTRHEDGSVTTPKGFKEAYHQFVEGGWPSMSHDEAHGGQGLPESLNIVISDMVSSSNVAWGMYPGLSHGAMNTIAAWGTSDQKDTYMSKLVSGEWTGTMCLTESHCGSDLGLMKSKAELNADGSYAITGSKIFISAGEHDMSDNIVHIVLARLPGAPSGTKGISLFIVPKFMPTKDDSIGERNSLECGSIEHKMGIKASATCVMNFDNAKGWLIGPENKGLQCMFTFMNTARIGAALQGSSAAEASYQGALTYAKDRLAMRSLTGAKFPDKAADPIIVHPDVRKLLLTQKSFAEGGRALVMWAAKQNDIVKASESEEERKAADELLGFLTPIAKAFLTETGLEATNHGVQVYGGHGFIQEWGMEQLVRDTRISTLYEGTTGIQALDLLGRKVMMSQGQSLKNFTKIIHTFCKEHGNNEELGMYTAKLSELIKEWGDLTTKVGMSAMKNRDEVGSASVDYLMYSGYVTLAYLWALMAKEAQDKLAAGTSEEDFYKAKIATARFYFTRILPRTLSHAATMVAGADTLMDLDAEHFAF
ncbi:MAG: acyl-CoA dehydrogenase C-terminal domain-containing protein [Bermanella sp.]